MSDAEPLKSDVEPVSQSPLGDAGTTKTEPTKEAEEPQKMDVDEGENEGEDDVDFMDLKTVPKNLQKAAKKLQASFTKSRQSLEDELKTKLKDEIKKEVESEYMQKLSGNPNLSEEEKTLLEYMETPQGSALKKMMSNIARETMGDLPAKIMEQDAKTEVREVIEEFGYEIIEANKDEIMSLSEQYKGVPLRNIVATVLYPKAKEMGAAEERSKFDRKSQSGFPQKTGTSNVVGGKVAETFDEAFSQASKELGY